MTRTKTAVILLALVLCAYMFTFTLTKGQNAASVISQTQNAFASSVQAVAQAQSSGANVDALMASLTQAADLLSKAQLANSAGDYSAANDYASQCQSKLGSINSEAASLQQAAANQKNQSSIYTALTLLVSAALLASGIASWFILNKRERRSTNDGSQSI